jgi:hypothetical protein
MPFIAIAWQRVLMRIPVALGDWFHPPVIHHVEKRGKVIRVQATDDVRVASVQVMVLDKKGKTVEKGEGLKKKGDWWEYMPSAEGKVVVEAWDLAGNVAKAENRDKGTRVETGT